ncbi:gamma-glutamyl-gamma-aminobutyrate hydrolase family protein [Nocardioides sp.]|nr:gamma-glutamyl-gamma-aminobutyrate hydrolase family protein [Nocardioides sp.]
MVGITTYREHARWGVWDQPADVLPVHYARAVAQAGGIPILLPPGSPSDAETVLSRLDGLVIAGGADVSPDRYNQAPHVRTTVWRDDRDAWELALLDAAGERPDLPVLGICRGMQLMAVHRGGSLEQHVPDRLGSDRHSPGGDRFGAVEVETNPGTALRRFVGGRLRVRCHHHQAVDNLGEYVPAAWAEDGTLEALEDPERPFCLGVQWHPEVKSGGGLFAALVTAADRALI